MKPAHFKAYNINRHLALAVADAAIALKRGYWPRSSESLVVQAAIIRFLSSARPGCPHLAKFFNSDHELRDRILNVAGMTAIDGPSHDGN